MLEEVEQVLNDCHSGHVVVICQAMPLLRKSFILIISGFPSLMILLWLIKNGMNVIFLTASSMPHQHPYT